MATAWAVSALLALVGRAHADASQIKSALEVQETRYQKLQKAQRAPVSGAAFGVTDSRGKTLSDDVRANVLTPPVATNVESLRASLSTQLKAGQLEAAEQTLASLTAALDREVATFDAISAYWASGAKNPPDRTSYIEYLRKNGIEPRYAPDIEAARQRLDQYVAAAQFKEAVSEGYPALVELIKRAAKEENGAALQKAGGADFSPFLVKERAAKCPAPPRGTSGTPRPQLVSAGAPGQNYYPAASKRLAEEGLVYVAVHVSAEGCPERATVTVSSGYPRLDATTLAMMLDSQFLPAAGNGQAVASDFVTVMKWELKD